VHAARGQLYLPLEGLDRHGVRREDIAARRSSPELRAAIAALRLRAREHLAQAHELSEGVPVAVLPAFLPVALTSSLLDRMEQEGSDPFVAVEIAQWRRQWLIWRAARRPSRIFS
jgi:phytoene synthase